jgi:hypothetical protein
VIDCKETTPDQIITDLLKKSKRGSDYNRFKKLLLKIGGLANFVVSAWGGWYLKLDQF